MTTMATNQDSDAQHEQTTQAAQLNAETVANAADVIAELHEEEDIVFQLQDTFISCSNNRTELPDGTDMLEDFIAHKGFQVRPSQYKIVDDALEEFFIAVEADEEGDFEDGLANGVNLQINAPVATGKSAAGVFIGLGSGQRTVLASSNKSLQNQYIEKDLPEIAEFLKSEYDYDLTFSIMKGQYNYANLINLRDALDGNSEFEAFHDLDNHSRRIIEQIVEASEFGLEQARETGNSLALDTGDLIAQLPKNMQRLASAASPGGRGEGWLTWWNRLDVPANIAHDPMMYLPEMYRLMRDDSFDFVVEDSPYMTAYWLAMTSDIAVVNQNLLIADLKRLQGQTRFVGEELSYMYPSLVRGAGMIIVDEAQHYPAILTSALSKEFTIASYQSAVARCIRRVEKAGLEKSSLLQLYTKMHDILDQAHNTIRANVESDDDELDADEIVETLNSLQGQVYSIYVQIRDAEKNLAGMISQKYESADGIAEMNELYAEMASESKDSKEVKAVERSRREVYDAVITPLFEFQPNEAWSVSVTAADYQSAAAQDDEATDYTVHMSPLNIRGHRAEMLEVQQMVNAYSLACGQKFWNGIYGTGMVIMSGTLSKLVGPKIGMERDYSRYISVASPMDASRVRYCVPSDLPAPTGGDYMKWRTASTEMVVEMVNLVQGRTMILCTSNSTMNEYAAALRKKAPGVRVIAQNDMDKKTAIELFKLEDNAVLLGVKSFWEGVDIPGDDLLLVIMDKIMFPIQDDPVYGALAEAEDASGGDSFINVHVDHAAFMFAQGAGRLQRSESDLGGILILDSRINTARYGSRVTSLAPKEAPFTKNYARFKKYMSNVVKHVDDGGKEPSAVTLTDNPDSDWAMLRKSGVKGTNRKPREKMTNNSGQRRFG